MKTLSRRDFLKLASQTFVAASGLLGLAAVLRLLGYPSAPAQQNRFDLGMASGYPLGSHTVLPDIPAILLHTEAGFSALSLVCTHLGCTLEQTAKGFTCPCHGSQFGETGAVLHSPAKTSLMTLNVEHTDDGHLMLYRR